MGYIDVETLITNINYACDYTF